MVKSTAPRKPPVKRVVKPNKSSSMELLEDVLASSIEKQQTTSKPKRGHPRNATSTEPPFKKSKQTTLCIEKTKLLLKPVLG